MFGITKKTMFYREYNFRTGKPTILISWTKQCLPEGKQNKTSWRLTVFPLKTNQCFTEINKPRKKIDKEHNKSVLILEQIHFKNKQKGSKP